VPPTYYEILGVSQRATSDEIEAAFKSKASEVHPDRVSPANPYLKNVAAEAFKGLSEAKAVLLDASKRQRYDAELAYSRGSSAKPPAGAGPATTAPNASASTAPAPAATARPPHPFLWLVNTTAGLIALSIVCATVLLSGGIALYRAGLTQTPTPAQTTPVTNPPENQSTQTKKALPATTSAYPKNREPRLAPPGSRAGQSRTIVLWRATEPPDLSALSSSDRQAIESACSYAKLMESPEIYNGCLAKELALRSRKESNKK
jgi:curved DNA-binding protein CbpA